jgi:hypothetical protein
MFLLRRSFKPRPNPRNQIAYRECIIRFGRESRDDYTFNAPGSAAHLNVSLRSAVSVRKLLGGGDRLKLIASFAISLPNALALPRDQL